jgi:hypothetical protein
VTPPLGLLARLAADDLDGARRLLAANEILGLAARVDGRVDELGAGISFGECHLG